MTPKDRDELAKELSKEWAQSVHIIKRLAATKEIEDIEKQKTFVNHSNDSYLRGVIKRLADAHLQADLAKWEAVVKAHQNEYFRVTGQR